jgi:internalin A
VQEALQVRWDEDRPTETACFRYAFLHGGLIRAIISHVGQIAGVDALYWRGGLFAYEAQTRSRILIEEEKGEAWQGAIRVRTQGGQAAALLQKAIDLFEEIQTQLGVQSTPVERSSPRMEMPKDAKIMTTQEKPALPEWYVSYAWGDTSPEGLLREQIVDRLCDAAKARGHEILRDKNVLGLGDSISAFMRRIGAGDRVFVILSEKYLRSPHCMFELNEIWRTSRQDEAAFRQRIRIFALPGTKIFDPTDWADWAIHWKQEHDKLENLARQHGTYVLGNAGGSRLNQMRAFYNQVADILATLADTVQPRTFEQLERHGFDDAAVQPQ